MNDLIIQVTQLLKAELKELVDVARATINLLSYTTENGNQSHMTELNT